MYMIICIYIYIHLYIDLTCKRGSVGQSEGLLISRTSVRFRLELEISNSHGFELHRPSIKGTKVLLKVIKVIIINSPICKLVQIQTLLVTVQARSRHVQAHACLQNSTRHLSFTCRPFKTTRYACLLCSPENRILPPMFRPLRATVLPHTTK